MAIQYKDYYDILGVPRDAGDEDVRRAFRKLARMYHPDITGNDRRAEDRFKEINEAYEVLGDRERRHRYDEFNSAWQNRSADEAWEQFTHAHGGTSKRNGDAHFTFTGSGFSDFFDELFGERSERAAARRPQREEEDEGRGDDLEADIWVSLNEVANGAIRQITMQRAVRCGKCLGMGQVNAAPCGTCHGAGTIPSTLTSKVKIPKGIREGALLRISGRGEEGRPGTQPGDLYLKVRYSQHSEFRAENGNLVYDLEVAPWEAVLGANLSVPTLEGLVAIKIPAGTRSGSKLRVRGRGLPSAEGSAGDLLVNVKVQVPGAARERERQLWEELARESQYQPREN